MTPWEIVGIVVICLISARIILVIAHGGTGHGRPERKRGNDKRHPESSCP
jgi:hypothetical protein